MIIPGVGNLIGDVLGTGFDMLQSHPMFGSISGLLDGTPFGSALGFGGDGITGADTMEQAMENLVDGLEGKGFQHIATQIQTIFDTAITEDQLNLEEMCNARIDSVENTHDVCGNIRTGGHSFSSEMSGRRG